MNKNSTRVTAVVGTTMALVIAGTAAVAAHGPRDRDDVRGFGGPQMADMGGMLGGPGLDGMRGGLGMGGGLRGLDADFERSERTIQTADGTTTVRVEQGIVDAVDEASLSFSLGSGEAVTVAIDEDTSVVAFEEQEVTSRRGWTDTRLMPSAVEVGEIAIGTEIVVWSDAEDDADFIASRVVITPASDSDEAEGTEADEADETVSETTEDAAATDA